MYVDNFRSFALLVYSYSVRTQVGVAEGHSFKKIKRELESDFLPSLISEYCLFAPMDLLNFLKVPVQYQVLVSNAESLLEAVGLSYIHEHGFPGLSPPDHGHSIREAPAVSSLLPQLPLVTRMLNAVFMPLNAQHVRDDFMAMDKSGQGYITTTDLRRCMDLHMLPGMSDPVASHTAAELLVRKADVNGDGRVSLDEYLRMMDALQRSVSADPKPTLVGRDEYLRRTLSVGRPYAGDSPAAVPRSLACF